MLRVVLSNPAGFIRPTLVRHATLLLRRRATQLMQSDVRVPEKGANVFLGGVVYGAVPTELASDRPIGRALIGHQVARLADVLDDDWLKGCGGHVRDVEAADVAFTRCRLNAVSMGLMS